MAIMRLTAVLSAAAVLVTSKILVDPMKHDIFIVNPRNFATLITKHRTSDGVAVVLHYNSNRAVDKALIDGIYNDFATEMKGMVRVGAVDCTSERAFCKEHDSEFEGRKGPTVLIYPPTPLPAIVYGGALEVKALTNATLRHIPGKNVSILDSDTYSHFISKETAVPRVLLFSNKNKPPVLFKALSNAFQDRMHFGLIPADVKEAALKYKIAQRPSLVMITGSGRKNTVEMYKGDKLTFSDLYEWLNVKAETFVKGGGFSDGEGSGASAISKPWLDDPIPEVTGPSHQEICFRDGTALCAILLTNGEVTKAQKTMLLNVKRKLTSVSDRGAEFKFMWLDAIRESAWRRLFQVGDDAKLPTFVVVNPHKRIRFVKHPDEDTPVTEGDIVNLLDKVSAGTTYTRIKGKLPTFAARKESKDGKETVKKSGRKDEL